MTRQGLLICGILAMLWYVAINIIVPMQYTGYDIASQTVSELSAIGAPTKTLWFRLCLFYSLLYIAFSAGIWLSANGNRKLKFVAGIIFFDGVFGLFWPPMHQREVLAAGGGTITDTLHIAWTFVHLVLMLLMIGLSAATQGRVFRIFSMIIVLVFFIFGILTTRESFGLQKDLPTPHIGIWERVNMGAYMLWVIVFAGLLMKRSKLTTAASNAIKKRPGALAGLVLLLFLPPLCHAQESGRIIRRDSIPQGLLEYTDSATLEHKAALFIFNDALHPLGKAEFRDHNKRYALNTPLKMNRCTLLYIDSGIHQFHSIYQRNGEPVLYIPGEFYLAVLSTRTLWPLPIVIHPKGEEYGAVLFNYINARRAIELFEGLKKKEVVVK